MTPQEIQETLTTLFGDAVQPVAPDSWQVNEDSVRLLVLLSVHQAWIRCLVAIAPQSDAEALLPELLTANFEETQDTRYALYENILWGVFQHRIASLTIEDFEDAIARLLVMQQGGLSAVFHQRVETQIRQIIQASKQQGQSLETTLQTLERFYTEGVMGGIDLTAEQRQSFLSAWRSQLERLWAEVE